ncbi:hypothetical protein ACFPM3_20385 [Streptomyces coeruleoprunus]|uniref:Uncharacterized protein n=1 Tax=Streptomyces coeruleoprunus TaxID=285563 RepID=A0ABV9XJW8_9ACTN
MAKSRAHARYVEELSRALRPVRASEVVRPEIYYRRQREMEKANLPFFWFALLVGVPLVFWLLSEL